MVELSEVDKLKVDDLKKACVDLGLDTSGKKADLVARLKEHLSAVNGATHAAPDPAPTTAVEPSEAQHVNGSTEAEEPPSKIAKIVFTAGTGIYDPAKSKLQLVRQSSSSAEEKAKALTEDEKRKQRAERFKDPDTDKLKSRAQRFKLVDPQIEKEKALARAERFKLDVPEVQEQKKKARAERFGMVDEETKMKQRADRFKPLGPASAQAPIPAPKSLAELKDEEEKRKARAERFAAK